LYFSNWHTRNTQIKLKLKQYKDKVQKQFTAFQCDSVSGLKKERVDATWSAIGKHIDETGEAPYTHLAQVMLGILTIPHLSAHCERVFSCVRKITDQRATLGDKTLQSLLVVKSRPGSFGCRHYTPAELKSLI
jgi:hypothetical protein